MTLALSVNNARERAAVSAMVAKSEGERSSLAFWARTAPLVNATAQAVPAIHPIRVIERIGNFLSGHRYFRSNAQAGRSVHRTPPAQLQFRPVTWRIQEWLNPRAIETRLRFHSRLVLEIVRVRAAWIGHLCAKVRAVPVHPAAEHFWRKRGYRR
jgi:hypothetical protein